MSDLILRSMNFPNATSYDSVTIVKTPLFSVLEPKSFDVAFVKEKKKKEKKSDDAKKDKNVAKKDKTQKNEEMKSSNFVEDIIIKDLRKGGKWENSKLGIRTRFPPEPNGYLHLGHAKSICLNFGLAQKFKGRCHLRMDDTNPTKEKTEYIDSIKRDVKWLGFDWGEHFYHASDYFENLYEMALILVKKGLAYVDDQSKEDMEKTKGDVTKPGTNSPWRNRTIEENLKLLEKMKNGDFPDGHCVLRAKIDMAHPQPAMRDPLMYRIRRNTTHPHVGDKWKIYPLYDFAHGLSDAIEGTLEFDARRDLYDWFVEKVGMPKCLPDRPRPNQYEMSRLNLETVTLSKRRLIGLVENKIVDGWDDPRMPTISGYRRGGIPPEAIREFCRRVGVSKNENLIELQQWNSSIRDSLDPVCPRIMAILDPVLVEIQNLKPSQEHVFEVPFMPKTLIENAPKRCQQTRNVTLTREIYIERSDFSEAPPKGWKRCSIGTEIRLKYACYLKCESVVKDAQGRITKILATYDPESLGGAAKDGRKAKGTIHWLSTKYCSPAEMRLYDTLYRVKEPVLAKTEEEKKDALNPKSKQIMRGYVEMQALKILSDSKERFQFERMGYFTQDCVDSKPSSLVFNRIITLKDVIPWSEKKKGGDRSKKAQAKLKNKNQGNKKDVTWEDYVEMTPTERGQLSNGQRKKLVKKYQKAMRKAGKPVEDLKIEGGEKKKQNKTSSNDELNFSIFDIRVGRVMKAWKHPDFDRLFCEHIDLGEETHRTVATGLWGKIPVSEFENSRVLVMCNLPDKPLKNGFVSRGMVLAAEAEDGTVELIRPPDGAPLGTKVMCKGHDQGASMASSWMKRKSKQWKPVLAKLKTDNKAVACYMGVPLTCNGAVCAAKSLKGATIK